jgi:hypothetical protein
MPANLSYFVIEQLPVLSPGSFDKAAAWSGSETVADWIMPRALELTFTSWDVEQFARDLAYVGPPYQWDPNRRFLLRAELDAAFFQLYGIARHDVDHILETFEIIRRQEEQRHSEYRTKRVILEIYDEMADAQRMGRAYRTRLDPPPADPSIAHVVRRRAGGDEGMAAV